MAGLCETRLTGSGETLIDGYTLLWSGHESLGRRGVSLTLSSQARNALLGWQPVSDRILMARFRHRFGKMSVIVAYAPTEDADDDVKEEYYNQLEAISAAVPPHDICILLTDANATIGEDARTTWPGTVGNVHIEPTTNNNGSRLLDMCQTNGLCVTDSWFPRRRIHHWTWYSNDGHTRKALDHIAVSRRWRSSVTNCKVFRGAHLGNTDHRLLVMTMRVRLKAGQTKKRDIRFDTTKLKDPEIAENFSVEIANRYTVLANFDRENWDTFKSEIQKAATTILRKEKAPPRRPWISPESLDLVEKRRKAKLDGNIQEYRRLNRLRNLSLKDDRERYWSEKADALQTASARNDTAAVYRLLRDLRDEPMTKISQIKNRHGEVLTTKEECLNQWKQHFGDLLNCTTRQTDSTLLHAANNPIPSPMCNTERISTSEVKLQLKRFHNKRAPGICYITAEILKHGNDYMIQWLTDVFNAVWENESIPEDWKKGVILPFWKGKGDARVCSNYRGITLLSVPGKLFTSIVINRAKVAMHHHRRPQQAGFMSGRGTSDQIASVRLLIEKAHEYRRGRNLCIAFMDLKSAFDSADRNAIWLILRSISVPEKIIRLLKLLHSDSHSCVRVNGEDSTWFKTESGVRQGCTAAPELFNCLIDYLMKKVDEQMQGVQLGNYRLTDLEFADDTALFAPDMDSLCQAINIYVNEASKLGLQVNYTKTKIMMISENMPPQSIMINNHTVEVVPNFIYLGSKISRRGGIDEELTRRKALASDILRRFRRPLWRHRNISNRTKMRIYNASVLSVLLYGSETWPLSTTQGRRLMGFDNRCQRRVLNIRWQEHITNEEVRRRTLQPPLPRLLAQRRIRWLGHMLRMSDEMPTKRVLDFNPTASGWRRPRGRPHTRWMDVVIEDLNQHDISMDDASELALDRPSWRRIVSNAASTPHRHET
jgi:hypothetical protein